MLRRVTIADDDPDQREVLRRVFQARHVRVDEAASGAELVAHLLEAGPTDLVVTDVSMPWMSGLDVLDRARQAGFTTPAIVITGADDPALAVRVARLGRARLLRKPFGLAELGAAIDELCAAVAAVAAPVAAP